MSILGNKLKSTKTTETTGEPPTNNLIGWWEATNIESMTFDGSNVTAWLDISGNENHLTSPAGAGTITWVNNQLNGRSVVRFDGKQLHTSTPLINITSYTLIAIAKGRDVTGEDNAIFSQFVGGAAGRTNFIIDRASDRGGLNIASAYATIPGSSDNSFHRYSYKKTENNLFYDRDGVSGTDTSANTAPNDSFVVGGYDQVIQKFAKVDIAEALLYNTALSTENTSQVWEYLLDRWTI